MKPVRVLSVGAVVQDGVMVGAGHDLEDFCAERRGVFDLVLQILRMN